MKAAKNCQQLPWDLLDIISRMIDFDDLFQFGSVCKNWRKFHKIYWRDFMAFQEPLLDQRSRVKNVFFPLSTYLTKKFITQRWPITSSLLPITGLLADI